MSVMSQTYSIIIDRGISAPGNGKEVVDGLNDFDKRYIYQLMSKVQLPGSVRFDSQIKMHTRTENKDVSLAKEFKDHLEVEPWTSIDIYNAYQHHYFHQPLLSHAQVHLYRDQLLWSKFVALLT